MVCMVRSDAMELAESVLDGSEVSLRAGRHVAGAGAIRLGGADSCC